MTKQTLAIGERARVSHGHCGEVVRSYNDGFAYLFRADSGAVFTVHNSEIARESAAPLPPPKGVPFGSARVVFRVEAPFRRQATPSQLPQADASRLLRGLADRAGVKLYSTLYVLRVDGVEVDRAHNATAAFCIRAREAVAKGHTAEVEAIRDGDLRPFGFLYSPSPAPASVEAWEASPNAGWRVVVDHSDGAAPRAWYGSREDCEAIAAAINAGTDFDEAVRAATMQATPCQLQQANAGAPRGLYAVRGRVVLGNVSRSPQGFRFVPHSDAHKVSRKAWQTAEACVPRWAKGAVLVAAESAAAARDACAYGCETFADVDSKCAACAAATRASEANEAALRG